MHPKFFSLSLASRIDRYMKCLLAILNNGMRVLGCQGNLRFKMASRALIRKFSTKFQVGDLVAIQPLNQNSSSKVYLTKLTPNHSFSVNTGAFKHNDIIDTHSRSVIYTHKTASKDVRYIVSKPTTEEYVNLIKRDAQPIYPMDAAAIVNLADLHIDYPMLTDDKAKLKSRPLQFLEAGTGHGSLSLQIAKALHPANCYARYGDLSMRGAVLHSIDCNPKHSKTGSKTVKEFGTGMYANNVEFHLSDSPTKWLTEQADDWIELSKPPAENLGFEDEKAFLSGAFLDMGGFESQLSGCAKKLKLGSPLVVFCPSVTQVMEALKSVDEDPSMNLQFVKTVQLLDGAGGGLKEWDTRKATIRATGESGWVCRPKVGIRVCGGGFVTIFRKGPTKMTEVISKEYVEGEAQAKKEKRASIKAAKETKIWWKFW